MSPIIAVNRLKDLGVSLAYAYRVLEVAEQYGQKCHPIADGMVTVTCDDDGEFAISTQTGASHRKISSGRSAVTLAPKSKRQYTSRGSNANKSGRNKMAPKGRAAAVAEPEVTEEEAAPDYTGYADKGPTPTMADFVEWLEIEVYGGEFPGTAKEQAAFANGVRLGGTLRMEFQKSDFNIERREERRAERAVATEEEPADETEAVAPAKPARGRATATAKPAATATAKPATRGRGRGKPVAAGASAGGAEAPF